MRLRFLNVDLLFPIAVMAFIGPAVKYVNILFNTSTRWGVLVLLGCALLLTGRLLFGLRSRNSSFGFFLFLYICWCLLTTLWSEVPELSLYKSIAFAIVSVAFLSAGRAWVNSRGIEKTYSYLLPILALVFFAGIVGQGEATSFEMMGSVSLYQGLTNNPNMFGSMVAMVFPLLLWMLYVYWKRPRFRFIWGSLLFMSLIFLLLANSRAAILVAFFTTIGIFFALKLKKQLTLVSVSAIVIFGTLAIYPSLISDLKTNYIYKSEVHDIGVLSTRESVWHESYLGAQQGGWFGNGYGVSAGQSDFVGGLTAAGYGREKGNTQLAVWEETGIVGLCLYVLIIASLFMKLLVSYQRVRELKLRIQLAIIIGMQFGLFVQSIFEAWWVAPGSPEAVYFWALTGVSIGLLDKAREETKKYRIRSTAL
jgi:hypothetical protein